MATAGRNIARIIETAGNSIHSPGYAVQTAGSLIEEIDESVLTITDDNDAGEINMSKLF